MTDKLDLNLFSVFMHVYHHQSITLAAEQLNVTQAAVSGSIKRLSERCGQDLFVRHGRGIIATHFAHQLMKQLSPAMDIMDSVIDNLQAFDSKRSKQVFTVLAFESITNQLHPHAMKLQQQGYPLIRFKEDHSTEEHINEALNSQQADLAIDTIENRDSSLICEPLVNEEIVLICRKGHPRISTKITTEQYYDEQHVTLKLTRANLSAVDFYAQESVAQRTVVAECHSLLSLIGLVAQSDCVGACSKSLAMKYQQAFNLQVIKMPLRFKPIQLSLIWHRRQKHNPAHTWLRDTIKSIFNNGSEHLI
ncbi:LysR family transcriptional regulator [Shewanella colwelliana]|uniref:LysR family transcriptional regulator n=1 Tax=Shewanella colwelliana TaxID=23 RepID=UPI001BC37354|nr:LysR family transcriptional regulator [Shewanella colwelliana]GIU18160.1 LysR family transcriptional regulator [Shewanella colwelliana]